MKTAASDVTDRLAGLTWWNVCCRTLPVEESEHCGEEVERNLRQNRLPQHDRRGVPCHKRGEVGHQEARCRRRKNVRQQLLLLFSDEARELRRDLGEGEDPVDVPARAQNAASLVLGTRPVRGDCSEDTTTECAVGHV